MGATSAAPPARAVRDLRGGGRGVGGGGSPRHGRGTVVAAPAAPGGRRSRARRGEGERLREQILDATEGLLIRTGDEQAVSVRAIADAVGVTPPSIYLHFPDKESLVHAVCERQFRALGTVTEQAAAQSPDPVESLCLRGRAYIRFGLDNPEQYRILFMTRATHGVRSDHSPSGFMQLVEAVRRCIETGAFRPDDPFLVAAGLWTAVHGLTSLLIARPDFPWPEVERMIDHVLDVALRGLRA